MNVEQAQRALEVGANALRDGNTEKAIRFFEKSISMHDTAQARALLARAKNPPQTSTAPGLRKRNTEQKTARTAVPQVDSRPYTKEQSAAVSRIKGCKDLYELLQISRNANEAEIKKAYRKLVIKVHPDKNSAPGADEAFKEVGRAYTILSDPQQRAAYDQYGDTSDNPAQQFTRRYRQEEFDPAELFREMFGGGFQTGGNVHTFHFGGGRRGGFQRRQQGGGVNVDRQASLLQLLPLLLLFFMSFASFPTQPETVFSFQKSASHPIQRTTVTQGIIPDIPFFVGNGFRSAHARDVMHLRQIERQVQTKYVQYVDKNCKNQRANRRLKSEKARKRGDHETYNRILEQELTWCNEWERINSYIRS